MNTQVSPENSRSRIALYIEVPGLKMNSVSALWRAALMKAKISRPLARAKLLWSEPLSGATADEFLDALNQVAQAQKQAPLKMAAANKLILPLARRWLDRAMVDRSVQVFAYFNWFFILADVSDAERGLSIIKEELERADLLRHSEIACCAALENAGECRLYINHPPGCGKSFVRHYSLFRQVAAYGENLLKGALI
jgi:hypothetical protein